MQVLQMTDVFVQSDVLQQEYWDDEDSDPEIYHYIVPAGLKVTFQDQAGNMITRYTRKIILIVRDLTMF